MHNLIRELFNKFDKLNSSEFISFAQVASLKDVMGVYMIFDDKKELIYIGHTNKFHIRFGTDLKHESTHTLVGKLLKIEALNERHKVVDHLTNICVMKIEICESKREAEALEHLAIYLLNPPFNNNYIAPSLA